MLMNKSYTDGILGDRVAIGAPYNGANGQSAGHVRVFRLVSSTWTQLGKN